MKVRIGCGSWADPEYHGILYPSDVPAKQRLRAYADRFNHVEVNSSYYATPKREIVREWVKQTPAGFTFNLKLHRAFSGNPRKTAAGGELIERLLQNLAPLLEAKRLGAFLLVLSPEFTPERHELAELDEVVERLRPHPLAVELRHSDWIDGSRRAETLAYFRQRAIAWVAVDMPRIAQSTLMPPVDEVTRPDLAYLRLHGRSANWLAVKSAAERHAYEYSGSELEEIAARVSHLGSKADQVHVIANNHAHDFAPKAALALQQLLGKAVQRG